MVEKGKIYALRTFASKDKTKQYFTAECLISAPQTTDNFSGLNQVTIFMEQEQYSNVKVAFKPGQLLEVDLSVVLMGNRVQYSVA